MLEDFERKMDKSISIYTKDIATIRAGRANPAILEKVMVEYYGTPTPISLIGNISVPEPHMLVIQPWDAGIISEIEKAINKSDIGINPQMTEKLFVLFSPRPQKSEDVSWLRV